MKRPVATRLFVLLAGFLVLGVAAKVPEPPSLEQIGRAHV